MGRAQGSNSSNGSSQRIRIQDVAKRCKLSITTVSQALNLRADQCRVSSETRVFVKRIADELGYRPSRVARGLAKGRSFAVAIVAYSVAPTGIYTDMVSAISRELAALGYHLILAPVGEQDDHWAEALLDEQLDGCLVLNNVSTTLREILGRTRLPRVLVNVESDLPAWHLLVNDAEGMRELTEYLLSLGHRRIEYFNGDSSEVVLPPRERHYSLRERENAFVKTINNAGGASGGVVGTVVSMGCQDYVNRLMSMPPAERPTAVICFWHRLAMRLLRRLWERGIRVPDEISVATFNDVEGVDDAIPPLTTVAIPNEEMGRRAVAMLIEQIESAQDLVSKPSCNGSDERPHHVTLEPKLVIRQSTCGPRP